MEKVKFYSLSTCIWCRKSRQHLDDSGIEYNLILMDQLIGDERAAAMEELAKFNPRKSYPTMVFGEDNVVIGFKPDEIRTALDKRDKA